MFAHKDVMAQQAALEEPLFQAQVGSERLAGLKYADICRGSAGVFVLLAWPRWVAALVVAAMRAVGVALVLKRKPASRPLAPRERWRCFRRAAS